jgi:acetyl esterase/lipase
MKLLLSFALALLAGQIFAQSGRYLQPIFQVSRTNNIQYGAAIPNGGTATAPLRLDWYQPLGDTMARRPVVFAFYGGSFIGGSTSASDIVAWCDSLTARGYVAIAVGYRVGFNLFQQGAVVRAGYRALQDGRAAIRYVKEFADSMRIDTNQIFLLGNSAGSITALQIAYADDSNRPAESFGIPNSGSDTTDLGCMDCSGNTYAHTIDIKGVVGLWGAILDLSGIDSNDRAAAIMFHGTDDTVVPIDSNNAFQNPSFPMLYGSRLIHNDLLAVGLESELYVYDGQPHNFYYDGSTFPNAYWDSLRVPSINFLCRHTIGCDTSQIVELSVMQARENVSFNVFPNPANERLQVVLPQAWATESNNILINIYNLQGQKVGFAPCLGDVTSVNTATLNNGFYVVELQHRDGRRAQQKFVVAK